jgi:hypothetical protein
MGYNPAGPPDAMRSRACRCAAQGDFADRGFCRQVDMGPAIYPEKRKETADERRYTLIIKEL